MLLEGFVNLLPNCSPFLKERLDTTQTGSLAPVSMEQRVNGGEADLERAIATCLHLLALSWRNRCVTANKNKAPTGGHEMDGD